MIGAAQNGLDIYVAFADELKEQVWIEKTTALNPMGKNLCMEMLQKIDDDREFVFAHQYFTKEGLLD